MSIPEDIPLAEPVKPAAVALPHPGIGFAILWAMLPVLAQLAVGIGVSTIVAVGFIIATGRPAAAQEFVNEHLQVLLVPLGTLTMLAVALLVCGLLFGRAMFRKLAWRNCRPRQAILVFLLTLPLAIVASELTNWVEEAVRILDLHWLDAFRTTGGRAFEQFNRLPFFAVFLGGCLLPGLSEEIYCRGFLSRGLIARHGLVAGTLATSFLFGAMHLDPVQASGAMLLGIGLQYVFLTSRSLLAPVVLHTLNNALAFFIMRHPERFSIPGVTPTGDGSVTHTDWTVLLAALAAVSGLLYLLWQTRTRWLLSTGIPWNPGYVTAEIPPAMLQARVQTGQMGILPAAVTAACYAGLIAALLSAMQ